MGATPLKSACICLLDWGNTRRWRSPWCCTCKFYLTNSIHSTVSDALNRRLSSRMKVTRTFCVWFFLRDAAPGSQLVSEKWSIDWDMYLASQRNFIVVQIDARGSGFQGEKHRHELYHKLGSVEIEDQIAVIKWVFGFIFRPIFIYWPYLIWGKAPAKRFWVPYGRLIFNSR